MSLLSPLRGIHTRLLEDPDQEHLDALLGAGEADTLYLRSLVHEFGISPRPNPEHGRFIGGWRGNSLVSVAFLGNSRNLTTRGAGADLAPVLKRVLEEPLRPRLFVGPTAHAPLVRRLLGEGGGLPALDRDQTYYVLRPPNLKPLVSIALEPAGKRDLEQVARAQAAMTVEDLLIPKDQIDLDRLRQISAERIDRGKIWVIKDTSDLIFKTEESARTPDGVLVGGVYTFPGYRGRGFAARGIAEWARRLFAEGISLIALHVNVKNGPAVAAYERVGFLTHSTLRLILNY